jgi:hypothetical protein
MPAAFVGSEVRGFLPFRLQQFGAIRQASLAPAAQAG